MFRFRTLLLILVSSLCLSARSLPAADATKKLAPAYRHWINEEVPYIISSEERDEFLALKSDPERDQFISAFWRARNPDPSSDLNTYKEEHYRRLAYANQQFGSTELQDGWRTDQGRVYITLGAPQQIVTYPNSRNVRALIIWFYQSPTPALPTHFNVLFFKRSTGDPYTLYSPYQDGPTRLTTGLEDLNVPEKSIKTIQKSLGDEVARMSISLIPTEPVDLNKYEPSMSSDVMLSTIRGLADNALNRDTIELRRHRELTTSKIITSTKQAEIEAISFREANGRQTTSLLFLPTASIRSLFGTSPDGKSVYSLTLQTTVTTQSGVRVYATQTALQGTLTEDEATALRSKQFAAEERLPLGPGEYKVTSTLTNEATHATLQEFQTVVVPDLSGQSWDVSRILAFTQPSGASDGGKSPFTISGLRFAPRGIGDVNIHPTEPLWIAFQMWTKPIDAKATDAGIRSHHLKITYSYGNVQSGASPETEDEEIEGSDFDAAGNLLTGHKIDTSKLEAGTYRLIITVLDEQTKLKAFSSMSFHVVPWSEPIELWTAHFSEAAGPRSDAIDDYKRGLSALAQSQNDLAVTWLKASLADDAGYLPALDRLVDLYTRTGRFGDIAELAKTHPVDKNLKIQTAILMAEANSKIGQPQAGSEILEAELQFQAPNPDLYRALSKLYRAQKDTSKADEFEQKAAALKQ